MYEVFIILEKNEKAPKGFDIGRTFEDGVKIAKANLKLNPNAKGLTNEEVQKFINKNYPPKEIDLL